jgi:hypothetical protein
VDGRDARVLELTGDPGLLAEPANERAAGGQRLPDHLEPDVADEDEVAGGVDDAHPAAGDLVPEPVRPPTSSPGAIVGGGTDSRVVAEVAAGRFGGRS